MNELYIYHIGAGDKEKDLVPCMLNNKIMMMGPGDIGDISGKSNDEVKTLIKEAYPSDKKSKDADMLISFRDAPNGALVVLRLGSVCFAVGAISDIYVWNQKFGKVYGHWNSSRQYFSAEQYWDLQHTRKVKWFVLKDTQAIFFFRRGIYGKQRFSKVWDTALKKYLIDIQYDGVNGEEILSKIGDITKGVNRYGFPDKIIN